MRATFPEIKQTSTTLKILFHCDMLLSILHWKLLIDISNNEINISVVSIFANIHYTD